MTTQESIKNKIGDINKILQSSIEDKTIFDECFKDHIIIIKHKGYGFPKHKGKSFACPPFQKPFEYDITKKFSKKSFNSFKKTVNNCILLSSLSHLFMYDKLLRDGYKKPDNNYLKLLTIFAHKKDSSSTKLFMDSVKECNASINIYVLDILVFPFIGCNEVKYSIRVDTEISFENE